MITQTHKPEGFLQSAVEHEIGFVLGDKLYEPSLLDFALVNEEAMEAKLRQDSGIRAVKAEQVDIESFKAQFVYGDYYREHFPDANVIQDNNLVDAAKSGKFTLNLMFKHGSEEVAANVFADLGANHPWLAQTVLAKAKNLNLGYHSIEAQFEATNFFATTLHNMRFIREDDMLRAPLQQLGGDMIDSLAFTNRYGTVPKNKLHREWQAHLRNTIGHEDLIGEDGEVMDDMVAGLYVWAHEWLRAQIAPEQQHQDENQLSFAL